jgi:pimeloyl-ACP methyl ester carboxylesterase
MIGPAMSPSRGSAPKRRPPSKPVILTAVELNVELWVDGPARSAGDVDPSVREKVRRMQRAIFEKGDSAGEALSLESLAIGRLEEVRAPTLAIVGDQDVPAIIETTGIIAARVPGARKAVIHNAAHVPNMEHPDEFNRLVLDFLDAHAPAS